MSNSQLESIPVIIDTLIRHKIISADKKESTIHKLAESDSEFVTMKHLADMLNQKDIHKTSALRRSRHASIEEGIKRQNKGSMVFPMDDPYRDSQQDELNTMFND